MRPGDLAAIRQGNSILAPLIREGRCSHRSHSKLNIGCGVHAHTDRRNEHGQRHGLAGHRTVNICYHDIVGPSVVSGDIIQSEHTGGYSRNVHPALPPLIRERGGSCQTHAERGALPHFGHQADRLGDDDGGMCDSEQHRGVGDGTTGSCYDHRITSGIAVLDAGDAVSAVGSRRNSGAILLPVVLQRRGASCGYREARGAAQVIRHAHRGDANPRIKHSQCRTGTGY